MTGQSWVKVMLSRRRNAWAHAASGGCQRPEERRHLTIFSCRLPGHLPVIGRFVGAVSSSAGCDWRSFCSGEGFGGRGASARRRAANQSPPEMPQSRAHASPPAPAAAATAVHRSSPPHPLPAAAARWAYSLWTMDRACAQRWDSTVSCQGGSWPAGCRRQHPSTSTRRCPHGLLCLLRPLPCSLEHVCHQHRRAADQGHGGPDD